MKVEQRILIVDDDSQFLETYRRVLREDGHAIDTATDRAAALIMLDQHAWDVVLLDQRLQGPAGPDSGLDLIAEVTRRSPGALIIVITGFPSKHNIEQAFEKGVYDYLVKDEYFRPMLRAKIRNALQYTRERRLGTLQEERLQAEVKELWHQANTETDKNHKGKLLEDLLVALFKLIPGLHNASPRRHNQLEEIDVVVRNELDDPFWQKEGSYILVECKNWSKPVGVEQLRSFLWKMTHRHDRCRLGIFVSPQGFTEPFEGELRALRSSNQLVITLDKDSLHQLIAADDKSEALKEFHERAVLACNGG